MSRILNQDEERGEGVTPIEPPSDEQSLELAEEIMQQSMSMFGKERDRGGSLEIDHLISVSMEVKIYLPSSNIV